MAFDSKDTAAFKGVWVFCEQREGVIMSTSYQLLSEGRKLANDLGVELCGVVLGKDIKEDYLKALGGYGADKVYYCNHELLDVYTTDAYTKVICDLVEDKKPEIFLIGATNIGRDLGPRCAARLHTGLTADCTHLDVDVEKYKAFLKTTSTIDVDNTKFEENTNLKMTRPAFGGHLMATIICPRFRPQMSTVRPGVMQTQPYDEAGAVYTLIGRIQRGHLSTTVYTFLTYLACFLTLLLGTAAAGTPLTGYGGREWLIGLALAVLCTLLGHSLFSWCLKYLSPSYVSAAKLCEPVFSSLAAIPLFGEVPGPLQLAGGAAVLGAVLLYTWAEREKTPAG